MSAVLNRAGTISSFLRRLMASATSQTVHPARILVSSARKPASYINLAKRLLSEHGEVQLSALGVAIASAVTVAEILKSRGLATDKQIVTALETLVDNNRTRQKPKLEIVLMKSPEFDSIIARETEHMQPESGGNDDDQEAPPAAPATAETSPPAA